MTSLLAISLGTKTLMAGDGLVCLGSIQFQDAQPKVKRIGRTCWGAAGDARACDLAMSSSLPRWTGKDPYAWAVRRLVPWLAEQLEDDSGGEPSLELLMGVGGTLLFVDQHLAVVSPGPYFAAGSAAEVALGALHASRHCAPVTQLRRAQEAVEELCSGVGGAWAVVEG